jgi:hypothetical protein
LIRVITVRICVSSVAEEKLLNSESPSRIQEYWDDRRVQNLCARLYLSAIRYPAINAVAESVAEAAGFWQVTDMLQLRRVAVLLALVVLAGGGCGKSEPQTHSSPVKSTAEPAHTTVTGTNDLICSIHWLGKKQIVSDTNYAGLMAIWNMPESARLESQTLDRLATAPWRLLGRDGSPSHPRPAEAGEGGAISNQLPRRAEAGEGGSAISNLLSSPGPKHLRPLLDDLVNSETRIEVTSGESKGMNVVMAVRVEPARIALWRSNLPAVLASWPNARPNGSNQWKVLAASGTALHLAFSETNGWFVAKYGPDVSLDERGRTAVSRRTAPPYHSTNINLLEIRADLAQLNTAAQLGWHLPPGLPRVDLTVHGIGQKLRTVAEANFPQPLNLSIPDWEVPTNIIHSPVTSFTAIRGIAPVLDLIPAWERFHFADSPDQLFCWAEQGLPMLSYCALPLASASNTVSQISDAVLRGEKTTELFGFAGATESDGLRWTGLPYMSPYVRSEKVGAKTFIAGGFFPSASGPDSVAPELTGPIFSKTNLIYYDWELMGPRVEGWHYMGQFFRFVTERAQLPFESLGLLWLKEIAKRPGDSLTQAYVISPQQISIDRKSPLGLTGIEMQLLMDWLESPEFPTGLLSQIHTNAAK